MKALSLIKFMTFVSMIIVTCTTAWGQGFIPAYNPEQSCDAAVTKVSDRWSEAIGLCRSSGNGRSIKDCGSALRDCADSYEEELPITNSSAIFGNAFPALQDIFAVDGGTSSACSDYTRSEYKSEERDIKRDLKDTKKLLSEAQKQKAKDLEDYNKESATLDEKLQEANVDKITQDLEFEKAKREREAKNEQTVAEMEKSIQDTELQILTLQQEIKNKAEERLIKIQDYKIEMLSCKIEAEEAGLKYAPRSRQAGSLGSATKTTSRADFMKQKFDLCIGKVLARRTREMTEYNNLTEKAEQGLAFLQQRLTQLKDSKKNTASRNTEEASQETSAKAQKDALDLQKKQNLLGQKSQAATVYQQKYAQNAAEINDIQRDVNTSSSDLSLFQKKKPRGKKSSSEAEESIAKYDGAKDECKRLCSNFPSKKPACSKDDGGSSSSKPSSGSAKGADGD